MIRRLVPITTLAVALIAPSLASGAPNLASPANGGVVSASSEYWSAAALTDGVRQTEGYWADAPWGPKPAWAQVRWDEPQRLTTIILRMPVISGDVPSGERLFGSLRVEYWDGDDWRLVDAPGNPILDWAIPEVDDGSQVKTLTFAEITTTKIRVYFEQANSRGDAGLEEIEAWTAAT